MEDEKIIDLYWERSENAISETDKKYRNQCLYVANSILNNIQDSEECLNDTYLTAACYHQITAAEELTEKSETNINEEECNVVSDEKKSITRLLRFMIPVAACMIFVISVSLLSSNHQDSNISPVNNMYKVWDYLSELKLKADFPENPDEYGGMTWVITLTCAAGHTEKIYHIGNMFIRDENGSWYKMDYDQASGFHALLEELECN